MQGERQMHRAITIGAPPVAIWTVLSDARLLPDWVPAVQEVLACSADGEAEGAVRTCAVELGGKTGRMVERCVELEPMRRIAYVVDDESFGMARMFTDYGFVISLAAAGHATSVTVDTHYTPRNQVYALLNLLVIRRQLRQVVDELLSGLRTLVESQVASPAVE